MNRCKVIGFFIATFIARYAIAVPIEVETKELKVIVIRPLDQWAPDSVMDKNNRVLNKFSEKEYSYSLYSSASDYTTQKSDDVLANLVKDDVAIIGWKPNTSWAERLPNNKAVINAPSNLSPKDAKSFFSIQQDYWNGGVLAQGNPATFVARAQEKRDGTGLVALATTVAGMVVGTKYLGIGGINTGFQATLGTGFSGGMENLISPIKTSLAYVQSPKTDFSGYKSVDIRAVKLNNDRSGQIIVAYKRDKSPETEADAMRLAIPLVLSMGESAAQIAAEREADFSARQALWNSCVSKGECKNDSSPM